MHSGKVPYVANCSLVRLTEVCAIPSSPPFAMLAAWLLARWRPLQTSEFPPGAARIAVSRSSGTMQHQECKQESSLHEAIPKSSSRNCASMFPSEMHCKLSTKNSRFLQLYAFEKAQIPGRSFTSVRCSCMCLLCTSAARMGCRPIHRQEWLLRDCVFCTGPCAQMPI